MLFLSLPLCLLSHMRGNWVRGSVYLGDDTVAGTGVWIDSLWRTGLREGKGGHEGAVRGPPELGLLRSSWSVD